MKKTSILGMSLLVAGMGLAVTAPVFAADAMAVSLGAVFNTDTAETQTATIGAADVTTTVTDVKSISVSAASGSAVLAGGVATATAAQTASGGVTAADTHDLTLGVTETTVGLDLVP